MFWIFIIAIGLAWIAQSFLSFKQTKAFTELFVALRRKGRVAMGKFSGGIAAGSIVMFVLDDDDRVVEGHRLNGITVLARFKEFGLYDGRFMSMVEAKDAAQYGKSVMKAVANARENYRVVAEGGMPAEPPTALARALDKLPGIKPKQKVLPSLASVGPVEKITVTRRAKQAA
ncbi:MAG: transcriptional regulator GutM [Propionibacteriaceae bacterium]|nr:transcriptional regulator GutM [Propionibacteriaceae bacterium]